jgi:murein DD-endopeptidase MepM/ murein hydrolase activator NlpD
MNPRSRCLSPLLRCGGLYAGLLLSLYACQRAKPAQHDHAAARPVLTAPAPQPTAAATAPVEVAPSAHTLADGETLWDIARVYGLSVDSILAQNGLTQNDVRKLRPGRVLHFQGASLPGKSTRPARGEGAKPLPELKDGTYHFLRAGESLWSLSRMYEVSLDSLLARNGFDEDAHGQLQINQAIVIPGQHTSHSPQSEAVVARAPAAKPAAQSGSTHTIAQGETVWDLARTYGVSVAEIMAANGLSSDAVQNVREGQSLFLPGVQDDGRGHVTRAPAPRDGRAQSTASHLGLGSLVAAGKLLHGRVEPRWMAAAGGGNGLAGTLRWPVAQGWFVRGFGSGQGGYHKAMDIMGKVGWNVRAAAPGIVGYSGDKVPGFGNMVMLVHPGGWVTLYAHNSVNFVRAGQRVQKGSVLAEVGSTGRSTGPHVHFELIYDGKNCDPAPLFRPGVRHRSGKVSKLDYASWLKPSQRPKSVQCAVRQKHPQPVLAEDPSREAQHVDEKNLRDALTDDAFSDLVRELATEQ